ncbi:testis-expressed protein 15 [Leptodactylus fuscus]
MGVHEQARGGNMEDQVKTSFGAKHVENKILQNFTIPKIKKNDDKFCLLRGMPNRREYGDILDTLNNGRLNLSSELKSCWTFSEIKLVINNHLTEKFFEKRNEMKELGRHSRELEDRFCFLVVPNQIAEHVAEYGLDVGSMDLKVLGNPEMGVYLFRHIDIALNFAHQKKMSSNVVLIFKVLFGKIKTVKPNSALKALLNPTPNFDSHISKKAPLWNDPFDEQVTNSLIYVYEYDSSLKPMKTPRHCLPIATVDATFTVNKTTTTSVPARHPSKPISSGSTTLANCTVVKRIGKGKDAMVIYKSVRPPLVQSTGVEAAQSNITQKEEPSVPVIETEQSGSVLKKSPLLQNNITVPDLSISLQQPNVAVESLITSCMVITSKSMKDPRLLKRNEPETIKPVDLQNPYSVLFENELSCNIEKSNSKENVCAIKDSINKSSLYLSFEERRVQDSVMTEEPFVKGLNKYLSFLTYNEMERNSDMVSLLDLSNEEKAEHCMKMGIYDNLFRINSNQLETEKSEFAVSMSLSSSNSEDEGKSEDLKCMLQDPNPKNSTTGSLYNSLSGIETGIVMLPKTSCEEKTDHPKKLCSDDILHQISARQLGSAEVLQIQSSDFMSLDSSKEPSENTRESVEDNKCLSQDFKDTTKPYLLENRRESRAGIVSLPSTFCEEKPELSKKLCSNDIQYRKNARQLATKKSHQINLSDLTSIDYSNETNENREKSETERQRLKIRDAARTSILPFKEKNEIKSLTNTSSEENTKLSKYLLKYDKSYTIYSNQILTQKYHHTRVSVSKSLNALNNSRQVGENGEKSETSQCIFKKQQPLNNNTESASFLSCGSKEKDMEIEPSPNTFSMQTEAVNSMPFNRSQNVDANTNREKAAGHKWISQDTIPNKLASASTTSLTDYYKEQCLDSKKHSLKDRSVISKLKLLKTSETCDTDVKQRSGDSDRTYNVVSHNNSEKLTQNKESQGEPVLNDTSSTEISVALNDKNPTSTENISSLCKYVSNASDHKKLNSLKAKENCSVKSPEKERRELDIPKRISEKARQYKRKPTVALKQSLANKRHIFKRESLKICVDTKLKNEKDSFDVHSSNKINSETSRTEESLLSKQFSPNVSCPTKASMSSSELDEFVKDITIDRAMEVPPLKKVRNQATEFLKNTHEDAPGEDLSFVTELESRIDWSGIFGMELEKVNVGTLQRSFVRQEKEPSGLRIFPDMEITITNNNYVCAHDYSNTITGEISKPVENFNDILQDHHMTDSIPRIEITMESPVLQDSKNVLKDNLDPLSTKVDSSVKSKEETPSSCPVPSETLIETDLNSVKTLDKPDLPTLTRKNNKKRIPSVRVKRSSSIIHKFSQSEENIKVVLGMLSDEIPLCKNKRISKKLDRAILHLRKAHKRVKKSLQLAAKAGGRRNLTKSFGVQRTHSVNGKEGNVEQGESSSSQVLHTEGSSTDRKAAEIQKSPTADRKCLTESTQVTINGALVQDSPQTKGNGSSATKTSPSCKVSPGDHSCFSSGIVSDKENTVPVSPSLKSLSDDKEKHPVNCESTGKDRIRNKLDADRNKRHTTKRMFSQVRKLSSSHTISISKCSTRKLHTVKEKSRLKGKRVKDSSSIRTKDAKISSLSLRKLSNILQKASKTDSLTSLQNCHLMCQNIISTFIKAFEKKQLCAWKNVIVDRRLFVKENLKTYFQCALKPQAIEAFLELQMAMETRQFVENRMHFIEGRPTFRSLLWYDGSLYTELFKGQYGCQQQSNFYSAFQEKLKLDSLSTLENHYTQLFDYLRAIPENENSYYVNLKYRRELQECKDVLKHACDFGAFSLSIPFTCGVHLGDTVDELTVLQKSTVEIIRTFINLPKCDPGKREHALFLLEVISAKIDYIKTSVSTSRQLSLFGIEHLLFDAAKVMAFHEQKNYGCKKITNTKELQSQINNIALSKLHEVYYDQCEKPVGSKKRFSDNTLNSHTNSQVFGNQNELFFGKIIDQARCAELGVLKKLMEDCSQHLEMQSQLFEILQECVLDKAIIQDTNVLDMAKCEEKYTTLLKAEAVEAYIDLAMTFETLHFLKCLMASRKNQERARGLLWYDTSLFSDLIVTQYRVESLLQKNILPNAMDIIVSTISEIRSELEIISNSSNSVNYTYAFQIMTRELSELSELKNFMKTKRAIATYINFSPFVASLHYGNSLTELDYNYNQLSDYLRVLLSAPKKDLGKLAHTVKILKTIEFAKTLAFKPGISTFHFVVCNVLHNRKKHSQFTRKRLFTELSDEDPSSSGPKMQKTVLIGPNKWLLRLQKHGRCIILTSSRKESIKVKEVNQVKSGLRPRNLFKMLTTEAQHEEQHPGNKDCMKHSPLKDNKMCLPTGPRKDYGIAAVEEGIPNGKDSKTSPSDQDKMKKGDSLGKCQNVPTTTDTHEFTLNSPDHPQTESKGVDTFIGPEDEYVSIPFPIRNKKVKDKFTEEKDSSLENLSVCSMDINTSEELNPSTTEQEERKKESNLIGTEEHQKSKSATWNSQSVITASGQYPPPPVSANPWQYSSYGWYQNGTNTRGVTQEYSHVAYSTQQTSHYNQPPAFPLPNSYFTNQSYSGFSGQIRAQMYSVAGAFGANAPYSYTDQSSLNQNPLPNPYSYSSTVNTCWPWVGFYLVPVSDLGSNLKKRREDNNL